VRGVVGVCKQVGVQKKQDSVGVFSACTKQRQTMQGGELVWLVVGRRGWGIRVLHFGVH
jgi:hypothetical protein